MHVISRYGDWLPTPAGSTSWIAVARTAFRKEQHHMAGCLPWQQDHTTGGRQRAAGWLQ